jgi:hypothetical protein
MVIINTNATQVSGVVVLTINTPVPKNISDNNVHDADGHSLFRNNNCLKKRP